MNVKQVYHRITYSSLLNSTPTYLQDQCWYSLPGFRVSHFCHPMLLFSPRFFTFVNLGYYSIFHLMFWTPRFVIFATLGYKSTLGSLFSYPRLLFRPRFFTLTYPWLLFCPRLLFSREEYLNETLLYFKKNSFSKMITDLYRNLKF